MATYVAQLSTCDRRRVLKLSIEDYRYLQAVLEYPHAQRRRAMAATIERLAADGWQAEGNSVHVDVLEIGSGASHNGLSDPQVLYTADMRALENDEIFVDFITGNHDAFVIEDADHLLMARSNGNVDTPLPGCGGWGGSRTGPKDHLHH
jgi:hypothetical protein